MSDDLFHQQWSDAPDSDAKIALLLRNPMRHNDALLQAAQKGDEAIVEHLLVWEESTADVHAGYDAALRFASMDGHAGVVGLLLEAGADVHADDDFALTSACRNGHAGVVALLLGAGVDAHVKNHGLELAIAYRRANVVELLRGHGATPLKSYIISYADLPRFFLVRAGN